MKNSDIILYHFLVESNTITKNEFNNLLEDDKTQAISVIASELLKSLSVLLQSVDTTNIDRSRGDIKQLRELEYIQTSLTRLEDLIIKADQSNPSIKVIQEYISTIQKAIFNLNKYATQFRDAYRSKKSVMILRYESVVTSIAAALSYVIAASIDYSTGSPQLKTNIKITLDTAALRSLHQFITSAATSEMDIISRDVNTIREFYNEISTDRMYSIQEASDIISTVIDGAKNFYNNLDQGGKTTNLIYKSVGMIAVLMSVREIFNTVVKSRFKISDLFDNIRNFANVNNMSSFNKLVQFASKYRADMEENSKLAQRDVIDQTRDISNTIKNTIDAPKIDLSANTTVKEPTKQLIPKNKPVQQPATDDFFF